MKKTRFYHPAPCFYLALTLCCWCWTAQAQDYDQAKAVVLGMTTTLLDKLNENIDLYRQDETELFALVESIIVPAVNMEAMSKTVLGRHAAAMTTKQKLDFQAAFKNMLIKSYSKTLFLLSDIRITYLTPETVPKNNKYQIIKTEVTTDDGKPPMRVDYIVLNKEQWQILDLIVDGLSLLKQFRESFSSEINEAGVDALITRLQNLDL